MVKKGNKLELAERFGQKYRFTYEEWFNELDNYELNFYFELLELYEKDSVAFLELLLDRKKQSSRLLKVKNITNRKLNLKPKRERLQAFYEELSIERFLCDIYLLPELFNYDIEDNIAVIKIGEQTEEGTYVPFNSELLQDGKLAVQFDGNDIQVSVQALIYYVCVNEMMHENDVDRLASCEDVKEAHLFAFNYVQTLMDSTFMPLPILQVLNPISGVLYGTIAYKKGIRFLTDLISLVPDEEVEQLEAELRALKHKRQEDVILSYANYLEKKVDKLEERESAHLKKRKELQDKLTKQKEQLDLQQDKVKELKRELSAKVPAVVVDSGLEKQLQAEVYELKGELKCEKDERKGLVKAHQKMIEGLEEKLEKAESENKRLVGDVSSLQSQLAHEKRLKLQTEKVTFEKWLEDGRQVLLSMTSEQQMELKQFLAFAEGLLAQNGEEEPKQSLATNRIGYCRVDADGHYVNFGDGQWHELKPFAANIYLSDDQFVEVTKDLELVRALKFYYEVGPAEYAIAHFTVVEERHGHAYAKIDGQTVEVKYKEGAYVIDGQVISVNKNNELISYFKNRSNTLDDLIQSIQLKGHQPLYITMALANGYVVRTLDGVESFVQFEELLPMHSMIVVTQEQDITLKDATGLMYKRSGLYKQKLLGSVSELEDGVFVLKQNQEYVQLHDVPMKVELELGDMVWVDEFNRFIEKVEEMLEVLPTETIEQRLMSSGHKVTSKQSAVKQKVEKDKNLLIIGNVRISERYKKYFAEFGYDVEVVDGTGPFEKINQACSKFETILYSTAFTSHRNSGKLAKEVRKPYILCDSTAPRVLHYALVQSV